MSALSLRGFLGITLLASLVLAALIAAGCLAGGGNLGEALLFALGGIPFALMIAGFWYLVELAGELKSLRLSEAELLTGEAVRLETPYSIVHYKSGNPGKFWEAVGGKLVLTSERLVFLAHRGQPFHYRLSLPLAKITTAETSPSLPAVPGGLLVKLVDETKELFTFGAVRAEEAQRWAAAIGQARNGR